MSEQITVTLPDGKRVDAARGTKISDFIREKIGPGLAKAAIFARLNDQDVDLSRPLTVGLFDPLTNLLMQSLLLSGCEPTV